MAEVALASRIVLAIVFAAAGLGKARNLSQFVLTLRDLGFGRRLARTLAPAVIAAEVVAALAVAGGLAPVPATLLVGVLLATFAAAALTAAVRRQDIQCNCFGAGDARLGASTIVRCCLLAVPAAITALPLGPSHGLQTDPLGTAITLGFVALAAILAGRWVLAVPALWRLMGDRRESVRLAGELPVRR